jgi:DNA-binding transcriptional ArsR family regulator
MVFLLTVIFEYDNITFGMHDFKAAFFKTLSHPTRLRILDALRAGELTVGEVQEKLEVAQSTASQHLAALRAGDFVEARRAGTSVWYRVSDTAIWELLDLARDIYERQLLKNRAIFEARR